VRQRAAVLWLNDDDAEVGGGMSMEQDREQMLAATFVELADTLVAGFDVVDFLHGLADRCVRLLDVDAAGLMLADQRGSLQVVASSSEQARLTELFQLQHAEGPCLECFQTGLPVSEPGLATAGQRWPAFAPAALGAGFAAVQALPMRLRDEVIGAMNLFRRAPGRLDETGLRLGQALADVATIGLLQERNFRHQEVLAEQLQGALNSRVAIEQAKGVLAERLGLDMDQAFGLLRGQARAQGRRLAELAGAVASGAEDVSRWRTVRSG
jgi:transcriptional regulator with GAF, ATPase, and Fis domain